MSTQKSETKKKIRRTDFQTIREIGKGKYGTVSLVMYFYLKFRHKKTQSIFALKAISKELILE